MGNKSMIYKSNNLIEARYKVSFVAYRIALGTISRINPASKEPLPNFLWTIDELMDASGMDRKTVIKNLDGYTEELMSLGIKILDGDSAKKYTKIGMFREFKVNENEGTLEIEFEERIDKHLRDFAGNFTKYQLEKIVDMSSFHAVRIYELLRMSYNKAKSEDTKIYLVTVDELKDMLGIERSAYRQFTNFRLRVLDVAKKQLEQHSDLCFEYETIKVGRFIKRIKFNIFDNEQFEELEEALTGDYIASNDSAKEPENINEALLLDIMALLPWIDERVDAVLMIRSYGEAQVSHAIRQYRANLKEGVIIQTTPQKYFEGILKNVDKDQSKHEMNVLLDREERRKETEDFYGSVLEFEES